VLNVTGLGPTVPDAARAGAAACAAIDFPGKQYRRDIAWREIRRAGAA
jgi:phosphoribosylamine-glycine ligase